uniref:RagB/SusD family nutrient uptake outer membrane protein n=1 Tax=Roseihalotalea indica TaxID=2867963 RepID=A0AA49GJ06_9BACT|nr:RagB/SusD family nutrient uptake outer membrane protein [Tunicatimonas sp. TK19036]
MKKLYSLLVSVFIITSCENDLDQTPPNLVSSNSLTDFSQVLNAAYYYQTGSATPLAVMGDFRSDNMLMLEEPYPSFDRFNGDILEMDGLFFRPMYSNLYKAILSTNNVIENSTDPGEKGEAQFLRALSYFKLVKVFGDVTVNLESSPSISDPSLLPRQPAATVYNEVIIPDLLDAILNLDNSAITSGRASQIAASALLGKVYMQMGDYQNAEQVLATVINDAASAGVMLEADFANVVTDESSEILFATQFSTSFSDAYTALATEFPAWFAGQDPKSDFPLDPDLVAAFDASSAGGGGIDLRKALTIDEAANIGIKYTGGLEQDFIELRLSDVLLLYAEALIENADTNAAREAALDVLDPIRIRAGLNVLDHTVLNTQELVRQAIYDERRLELALEGQRWFDLVRTGTVDTEMGQAIDPNYYLFPIPPSEVLASDGVITQNPGYLQ